MKQWLKNLAVAGATVGAVVLGAASASAVSFTVVIEKIELMTNGNSTDRYVIYNPAAGIGSAATSTIDLFNATAKAGSLLAVAAPKSGTYNTMLVTFSNISVSAETSTVSATQSLTALLGTAQGFGSELGRDVLIMGDPGTGAASISADLNAGVAFATVPPMQPIVSNGVTVSLPAFNFFMPASNVAVSGNSTVNVTKLPVPVSVARTDVDAASVPNVTIGVKPTAFKSVTTAQGGTTGAAFSFKTGLFLSALDLKPAYIATSTAVSSTAVTAGSVTEVTFLDVADGTYLPLSWIDVDADGLLDSGEPFVMVDGDDTAIVTTNNNLVGGADNEHYLTVNKSDIFGANATTTGVISTTSSAFNTSATTTGGSTTNVNTGAPLGDVFGNNATGFLGQSGGFKLFPTREISISIAAADSTSATINYGNDTLECTAACGLRATWAGGGIANATADATLTFTVGSIVSPSLTIKFDHDNTGGAGGANLTNTNLLNISFNPTVAAAVAASSSIVSYATTGGATLAGSANSEFAVLTISPVPLLTMTDLNSAINAGFGTYTVTTNAKARDNGTTLGAIDTATITAADVVLDSDAGGNYNDTTRTVRLLGANIKSISANLGN